jgi:hypothetical protein
MLFSQSFGPLFQPSAQYFQLVFVLLLLDFDAILLTCFGQDSL